ncbi:unnamed protein product [Closterium sp. NIES-65]|nr:unnamed protein product [Closterium sp. NIES-65]
MANPFAPAGGSPFGAAQPASPFGATSAFGASATPASPFGQAGTSLFGGGAATGSVFGATSAPAFGATSAPAFGAAASTPAFGSTASPFGGGSSLFGQQQKPAAFGTFGQTQASPFGAPAFGQQSQPAFGAGGAFGSTATTPTFGAATGAAPAFGAAAPAFGASAPAFGATATTPAFGAASAPAFGATGGLFGTTGTSAFGAASAPAFGSLSPPSFGASAPAFGATTFGATPFGAAAAAGTGSRNPAYTPTNDTETGTAGQLGKFISISAMPAYKNKSPEELRWEDYQRGDKGGPAPAQAGGGLFGQPAAAAASLFGAAAAAPAFGSTAANPFGQASTPSLFGSAAPAFGAAAPGATPAFGASTSPSLFGSSTPAFGAASSPAFGATGGSLFGATASSPFGAAASTPSLFGSPAAATASPFGASTGASLFGGTSPLGQAGAAGQPGASLFGASSPAFGASAFGTPGAAAATPAFGATPSLFGTGAATGGGLFGSSTPAAGSTGLGFGFGTAGAAGSAPGFGAAGGSLFGGAAGAGGTTGAGLFGASTGSAFGFGGAFQTKPAGLTQSSAFPSFGGLGASATTPGFGASQPSFGGGLFGSTPQLGSSPFGASLGATATGGLFGQSQQQQQQQQMQLQQQQQQQLLQQLQQSGLLQSPFGVLPAMPNFGLGGSAGGVRASTELGISSMPASDRYASGTRVSSILTPRRITPRTRARMHHPATRHFHPGRDTARVPFFFSSPSDHDDISPAVPRADALFVPRDNPRALFIRHPVAPAADTAAAGAAGGADAGPNGKSPAAAAGGTPGKSGSPQGSDYQSPPSGVSPRDALYAPSAPPYDSSELNGNGGSQSPRSPSAARAGATGGGFGSAMPSPTLSPAWNGSFSPPSPSRPTGTGAKGPGIESQLPRLKSADYFTEPSLSALAALERSLPGSLARVRDFVVGRKGFGSVRFLGETDVRGLDVEGIVQFHKCEILVYMDEESKPPVGEELNKPAEVTLLQVVCVDKKTGKAVTEGPEVERFERKLRRKTAEQDAEFLSFNAAKGEWRFKVQHFSRYGLEDSDEDDEEEEDRGRGRGEGEEDGREDDGELGEEEYETDEGLSGDGDADGDAADDGNGDGGGRGRVSVPPGGVSLDRALPAQLGIDPIRLQQMRQVMFGRSATEEDNDGDGEGYNAGFRGNRRAGGRVAQKPASFLAGSRRGVRVFPEFEAGAPGVGAAGAGGAGAGGASAVLVSGLQGRVHAHVHPAAADALVAARAKAGQGRVVSGVGVSERQLQHEQAVWQLVDVLFSDWQGKRRSDVMQGSGGVEMGGGVEGDAGEKAGDGSGGKSGDGSMEEERDGEVEDGYGEMEGMSGGGQRSGMEQGERGKGVREEAALNRRLFADDDGEEEEEETQRGAAAGATGANKQPQWIGGPETAEEEEKRNEQEEEEGGMTEEEEEVEDEERGDEDEEEAGEEEQEEYDEETMEMFRRAEFSAWLQAVVAPAIVHELNFLAATAANPSTAPNPLTATSTSTFTSNTATTSAATTTTNPAEAAAAALPLRVAFTALTGMQVETAVGAAALTGDVRLAALLSLAHSAPPATRADAARQLALWERLAGGKGDRDGGLGEGAVSLQELAEGALVSVERLRLLRLVAGDVTGALEGRPLDWKRHLGLLMWFGMPPAEPLGSVIGEFRKRVRVGRVPRAIPWYEETIGVEGGERAEWERIRGGMGGGEGKGKVKGKGEGEEEVEKGGEEDVLYGLLVVHLKEEMGKGKVETGDAGDGDDVAVDVAAMLRWRSWTRDALDCHLTWHLQSVLQAIGALQANEVLPAVHMDYVAQLLAANQPHWALYCLQHVPPSRKLPRWALERAFREVLAVSCPVWAASEEQQSFIEGQLLVPRSWMCAALAVHHRYEGRRNDELQCLLGSFQWDRAHRLFMSHLAAAWILSERWAEVQQLMEGLETHGEAIYGWKEGGRLLLDYMHLSAALEGQAILPTEELTVSVADGAEALSEFSQRTAQSLRTFPHDAARLRMVYARMLDSLSRSFLTHTAAATAAANDGEAAAAASAAPLDAALATSALPALPRDSRLTFTREAASELASWLAEVAPVQ